MTAYLPNEYAPKKQIVIDYLYDQGLLKRKSDYAFASFCVKTLISNVIDTIKKQQNSPRNP